MLKQLPDEEENFKKYYGIVSIITSTIVLWILPIVGIVIRNGGELIPHVAYEVNWVLSMLIFYAGTLAIASTIPFLLLMGSTLLQIGFNIDLQIKDNLFLLAIQNAIVSIIACIIFPAAVWIAYEYNAAWFVTLVPIIYILLLSLQKYSYIKNWLNSRNIRFLQRGVLKLQLFGVLLFLFGNILGTPYIFMLDIDWGKDYYSFKDHKAVVKIKGMHEVANPYLFWNGIKKTVKYYYANSDTYFIIDFSQDFGTDERFLFEVTVNKSLIKHEFVYIFDGTYEDRVTYIDKALSNISELKKDDIIRNQIKEAYINGEIEEIQQIYNKLKNDLSPDSKRILQRIF